MHQYPAYTPSFAYRYAHSPCPHCDAWQRKDTALPVSSPLFFASDAHVLCWVCCFPHPPPPLSLAPLPVHSRVQVTVEREASARAGAHRGQLQWLTATSSESSPSLASFAMPAGAYCGNKPPRGNSRPIPAPAPAGSTPPSTPQRHTTA